MQRSPGPSGPPHLLKKTFQKAAVFLGLSTVYAVLVFHGVPAECLEVLPHLHRGPITPGVDEVRDVHQDIRLDVTDAILTVVPRREADLAAHVLVDDEASHGAVHVDVPPCFHEWDDWLLAIGVAVVLFLDDVELGRL